jgi:hypothetical protein
MTKCSYEFHSYDKWQAVFELSELAQKSRNVCESKRWQYTPKNGETVTIRDLVDKLVGWIDRVMEVGVVAVRVDSHTSPSFGRELIHLNLNRIMRSLEALSALINNALKSIRDVLKGTYDLFSHA